MGIQSSLILTLVLACGFMVSLSVFLAWIAPSVVAETRKKKQQDSPQRTMSRDCYTMAGDPKEKAAGLAAKTFVKGLLHDGGAYTLTTKEKGKFGRYLGVIMLSDKTSVNAALVSEHLAVPYYGQSKQEIEDAHVANYEILKEKGLL